MNELEFQQRTAVVKEAESWLGTAFHDHGEVKGAGVDCAKMVKLVYRDTGLIPDFEIKHYSPQFFLHRSTEAYMGYVLRFAHEIPESETKFGDLVLYKIERCFAHGAIVVGWPDIIHAWYRDKKVVRMRGFDAELGVKERKFFTFW